ncbi:hypothetical protein AR9_g148 [Bacillus phage AR9]|uniref:Uncharacterized protein n=2 Tax=Bacillus phage PBS1 TaxID=10683 RepID=A0A172JI56_BPPB1|nr:hypothetical protein BI022_gp147 [Bacillus phage AR9]YP_009664238.1 hypothetical protein FK780_gp036 [Bacillus phage PBS1]QXN70071.1 hypothetical protein INTERNEXUS_30 [Bacillus phage vB_BspM_Internexus]AMS01232.1 hypothetical protein AR9_g148 [Bacillus phage AR9]AST99858.1 hypothetical protein PBI_PBS1_36 [Bacillus phage PBS1]BDE75322.1 hypothetical protein [Bacillus phage PBS1]
MKYLNENFYLTIVKGYKKSELLCGETTKDVINKLDTLNKMSDPKKPTLIKRLIYLKDNRSIDCIIVNDSVSNSIRIMPLGNEKIEFK